jgi:hypothetical protein
LTGVRYIYSTTLYVGLQPPLCQSYACMSNMAPRRCCHVLYVVALALFFSTTSLFTITCPFNVNTSLYNTGINHRFSLHCITIIFFQCRLNQTQTYMGGYQDRSLGSVMWYHRSYIKRSATQWYLVGNKHFAAIYRCRPVLRQLWRDNAAHAPNTCTNSCNESSGTPVGIAASYYFNLRICGYVGRYCSQLLF